MKICGIDPSINATGVYTMELDDDTLVIIRQSYLGFSQVKKNSDDSYVYYYKKKDFKNYIEQNIWMQDSIINFIYEPDYVAMEGYAYGATGRVFEIGEFCGGIKQRIYQHKNLCKPNTYAKMRIYDPASIKMYATGKGNCDKISMCDEYDKYENDQINLSHLPQYKTPKEDIVDAYYICKLLRLELMLRRALIKLEDLNEVEIKIFNRCTKTNPVNILARDFIGE